MSAPTAPGFRWAMLALDAALYASFGLASTSTAALAVSIAADLDLSPAQMGAVLGSWQLAYVGCAFAAGIALDRFGVRRAMAFGGVVIGASAFARSFAVDFPTLFVAVGLFGLGGPMISVGSNKVISEWFPGRQRGTAMGIATSAPGVGSVAVLLLANSVLAPALGGWRGALLACGLVSLVAAAAWVALAREAPRFRAAVASQAPHVGVREAVTYLLRLGNVRVVLAGALATFLLTHGLANWLPTLLVSRGFSPAESGLWAAVSTALGLPAGLLLPRSVGPGRRRYLLAGLGLVSALAVLGMALLDGWPLLAALGVLGVTRAGATPLMMLVLMDMREIGAARTGAAAGLYFTVGEVGGFGGPFVIGVLRAATHAFVVPLALLAGVQLLLALLALRLVEQPPRGPD